jgi:hypothetical protein
MDGPMVGNSRVLQKSPIFVELSLSDGSALSGNLFTPPHGRVIDTLNDDRAFVPFEAMDGTTFAVAKANIRSVKLPAVAMPVYRGNDPYLILGISPASTADDAKTAYHHLCFLNHPDRVRGLGLGNDFVELATQNMMRINNAYSHILRTLRLAAASPDAGTESPRAPAARRKAA